MWKALKKTEISKRVPADDSLPRGGKGNLPSTILISLMDWGGCNKNIIKWERGII